MALVRTLRILNLLISFQFTNCSCSCPLGHFKETRMLATGVDNSCKLSAYLNYGCISPRQVYAALQQCEGLDEGKETLKMHLQIRLSPDK